MMHLATTFIALTYALSGNLRTSLTHAPETPSSFIQKGSPDSFADLDAKLKQMEEKTKAELAKLQADTADPSSFVQEGSPDSFADIDAKLKQMEDKTKAELAKLQADTAAPSSFAQMRRGDTKGDDDNDDDDDDDDNSIDGNVDYGQLKKQMVDMQNK